jgi:hypothetical protein
VLVMVMFKLCVKFKTNPMARSSTRIGPGLVFR